MENSYVAEAFTKMVSTKLVINAGNILRANGFGDLEILFSTTVRENRHFKVNVMCEELVFEVPEIDLYDDMLEGDVDEKIVKYVESFGAWVAYEYAQAHGKDIGLDKKYAE